MGRQRRSHYVKLGEEPSRLSGQHDHISDLIQCYKVTDYHRRVSNRSLYRAKDWPAGCLSLSLSQVG